MQQKCNIEEQACRLLSLQNTILEELMRVRYADYCQHIIYVSLHQILVNNYQHGNPLLWSGRIALA